MSDIDLSVIVPIKNVEANIESIISLIADKCCNMRFEIIITDLNSADDSVGAAFDAFDRLRIPGTVIHCGSDVPGCALNCGMDKANGKYVTFIFPRRLFVDCIDSYFCDIEKKKADLIFASAPFAREKSVVFTDNSSMSDIFDAVMYGKVKCDIASMMVSLSFLRHNNIHFSESLTHGYSDDFISKVLIKCSSAVVSTLSPERCAKYEAPKSTAERINESMRFERLDAAETLIKYATADVKDNKHKQKVLIEEKIPATVLACIDALLAERYTVNAIKNALKKNNHDSLLRVGRYTSPKTRRKIIMWRLTPHLYK